MATRGGRPAAGEVATTGVVRVREDLARIIKLICDARGVSQARLLDPVLREVVMSEYAAAYEIIHLMHQLRLKANPDLDPLPPLVVPDSPVGEVPAELPPSRNGTKKKRGRGP